MNQDQAGQDGPPPAPPAPQANQQVGQGPGQFPIVIQNQNHGPIISSYKPQPFDGEYATARAWLTYFLRYAQFAQLTNPQRCQAFSLLMSGYGPGTPSASSGPSLWFEGLPNATKIDWNALLEAFRQTYVTGDHVAIQRRLGSFVNPQRPNETIQNFMDRCVENFQGLNFDLATQVSLVIQNLRPEFRSIALLALPVDNLQALRQKLMSAELSFTLDRQQTATAAATQVNSVLQPETAVERADSADQIAARLRTLETEFQAMTLTEPLSQSARFSTYNRPIRSTPRWQSYAPTRPRCFLCNSPWHLMRQCQNGRQQRSFWRQDFTRSQSTDRFRPVNRTPAFRPIPRPPSPYPRQYKGRPSGQSNPFSNGKRRGMYSQSNRPMSRPNGQTNPLN